MELVFDANCSQLNRVSKTGRSNTSVSFLIEWRHEGRENFNLEIGCYGKEAIRKTVIWEGVESLIALIGMIALGVSPQRAQRARRLIMGVRVPTRSIGTRVGS